MKPATYNCLVVLGPTASGKTRLACQLAYHLRGEIISADSRQVYKGLNIGTGKDLAEYSVNGQPIPYHLIDVVEPNEQFYLHQFAERMKQAFQEMSSRGKLPIICGGTGLYLDALVKDFSFTQVKENQHLRATLDNLTKEELIQRLKHYPEQLWVHVDLNSKKRLIRGIEIAVFRSEHPDFLQTVDLPYKPYYIGLNTPVELRREKISQRLKRRLEEGLIEEVESLLKNGVTHERLEFFGLEYKFVSRYLRHQLSREQLEEQLQTAIFQFAKRQMTWFRKMEKEAVQIRWLDAHADVKQLAEELEGRFS